ncbi:hypothetical protein M422DRAFT_51422 [Sphaerobolus stellatus SS14]|uniref:Uncharacterized protein n=1 Tax=Sphaerobolus stellatus (strain SS14) TaxID=990650 RepID=A0A0C9TYY5_SPHS4|nr:hypothetical protein M422DRAFT_51422 [Sphaerobolus stellatus SS14]
MRLAALATQREREVHSLTEENKSQREELMEVLSKSADAMEKCKARLLKLQKENHALKARIAHFPKQLARAIGKVSNVGIRNSISLKRGGVVTDEMRALIREMMVKGVAPGQVYPIMQMVTDVCGVNLEGSISAWTATRIMIEALPGDDLCFVEAIKDAAGIVQTLLELHLVVMGPQFEVSQMNLEL